MDESVWGCHPVLVLIRKRLVTSCMCPFGHASHFPFFQAKEYVRDRPIPAATLAQGEEGEGRKKRRTSEKDTRSLTWVTDKILHTYTSYDTSEVCLKKAKMKTYSSTKKKRLFSAVLLLTVDFGPPTFNGDSYQTKH